MSLTMLENYLSFCKKNLNYKIYILKKQGQYEVGLLLMKKKDPDKTIIDTMTKYFSTENKNQLRDVLINKPKNKKY